MQVKDFGQNWHFTEGRFFVSFKLLSLDLIVFIWLFVACDVILSFVLSRTVNGLLIMSHFSTKVVILKYYLKMFRHKRI